MSLTHAAFALAGVIAAAGPVIIHLLNRRRFRTVEWGAMAFLRKALQRSRRAVRLRRRQRPMAPHSPVTRPMPAPVAHNRPRIRGEAPAPGIRRGVPGLGCECRSFCPVVVGRRRQLFLGLAVRPRYRLSAVPAASAASGQLTPLSRMRMAASRWRGR